jgi:hypothetical protein
MLSSVIEIMRFRLAPDTGEARWDHDPVPQGFMALLDRTSVTVERYQELD